MRVDYDIAGLMGEGSRRARIKVKLMESSIGCSSVKGSW